MVSALHDLHFHGYNQMRSGQRRLPQQRQHLFLLARESFRLENSERASESCKILFPVFGGEMATAKIQTVKGLRVEIFSRPVRKNTTRLLTAWIVGTDGKRRLLLHIGCGIISPVYADKPTLGATL